METHFKENLKVVINSDGTLDPSMPTIIHEPVKYEYYYDAHGLTFKIDTSVFIQIITSKAN